VIRIYRLSSCTCSRRENADLFKLAVGGYGLFGPIATVKLRLSKTEAFRQYSQYYLTTNGQVYGSDTHQFGAYIDDYHKGIDARLGVKDRRPR
jgi:hypothetical protein